MTTTRTLPAVLVATLALVACGDHTTTRLAYAPGWKKPAHALVSVVGVFRGGRLDESSWKEMEPYAARALASPACPAAFDEASSGEPAGALVRTDEGLDDAYLATVAANAEGDFLLVVAEDRARPAPTSAGSSGTSAASGGSSAPKGKGIFLLIPLLPVFAAVLLADAIAEDSKKSHRDDAVVDFVGILFSRAAGKTVAAIHAHVPGMNEADARRTFALGLGEFLPGLACGGWKR